MPKRVMSLSKVTQRWQSRTKPQSLILCVPITPNCLYKEGSRSECAPGLGPTFWAMGSSPQHLTVPPRPPPQPATSLATLPLTPTPEEGKCSFSRVEEERAPIVRQQKNFPGSLAICG